MADAGHEATDKLIEDLEKRLYKEYNRTANEMQKKLDKYFADFDRKDREKLALVEAGKMTQEEYGQWRYGQMCVGERWIEMRDVLSYEATNTDMLARHMIMRDMPQAYALNYNWAFYDTEVKTNINTSFTLYNRQAVESLMKNDPRLLPWAKTESPTAQMLRERIDLQWNRQHIQSEIVQGILQGETIPKISQRLRNVTDMDRNAAIRNARTMMTSAENKGRVDAYQELRDMGIQLKEVWVATLDQRTRTSHRWLHDTTKDEEGYFQNGLAYPGDPDGEPEEVYNCRCCEVADVVGYESDLPKYSEKMGDMTFEEWLGEHNPYGNDEFSLVNPISGIGEIDFSSNIEKEVNAEIKIKLEKERERLASITGATVSFTDEISLSVLTEINDALDDSFKKYPQLSGLFSKITAERSNIDVFSFRINMRADYVYENSLNLNPVFLNDKKTIEKTLNDNLGFWSEKDGIKGLIEHEVSHMLEFAYCCKAGGISPWLNVIDEEEGINRDRVNTAYMIHGYAKLIIIRAQRNLELPADAWKTRISSYVTDVSNKYGEKAALGEALSEARSDISNNPLSKEISKLSERQFR